MSNTALSLQHPKLQSLHDYWMAQHAGTPVPVSDVVDPDDLKPWLGNLLVMDVVEGDNFIYSYYGKSFADAFQADMMGRSIELLPEAQRTVLQAEYDRVRRDRVPATRVYTADFDGQPATWERLVLPLSSDGEIVDKLLVAAYRLETSAADPA
jgi:hypothetical protein